jgi:hypothetical protein
MRWVALGAYLGDCGGSALYLWKKYARGSGYHKIKLFYYHLVTLIDVYWLLSRRSTRSRVLGIRLATAQARRHPLDAQRAEIPVSDLNRSGFAGGSEP